jgi:hypothetical protein
LDVKSGHHVRGGDHDDILALHPRDRNVLAALGLPVFVGVKIPGRRVELGQELFGDHIVLPDHGLHDRLVGVFDERVLCEHKLNDDAGG